MKDRTGLLVITLLFVCIPWTHASSMTASKSRHIKGGHGPLGKLWPIRQFANGGVSFLEGGGTIAWLGLVNKGV
ncbi:MAG: hypothetical protein ISS70_17335 [Phycisphaerae bacterium]|nr:hypothetical protein [Phycisphaerae bacterium]